MIQIGLFFLSAIAQSETRTRDADFILSADDRYAQRAYYIQDGNMLKHLNFKLNRMIPFVRKEVYAIKFARVTCWLERRGGVLRKLIIF